MKVLAVFLTLLWNQPSGYFVVVHNLAAEVPKRRFPNRMDLFLYGTSDVNALDRKDLLGM